MLATLVETPTPERRDPPKLSFRWWEPCSSRTCACGREFHLADFEPPLSALREDGCWDTSCTGWTDRHGVQYTCHRVVTVYDINYPYRPLPRGPAPTQAQREAGLTEEDVFDDIW